MVFNLVVEADGRLNLCGAESRGCVKFHCGNTPNYRRLDEIFCLSDGTISDSPKILEERSRV